MKKILVVVILTYNESIHIERAIRNALNFADQVIILDSYSLDDTVEKAKSLGAEVIFRKFDNYKNQRQFAIDFCKDNVEWLLFLDADEYLTEELKEEMKEAIKNKDVMGYYITRRLIFMEKWIKHGGYYPTYIMRLFRPKNANLIRKINEHVIVIGNTKTLKYDLIHHDLKGINSWISKHNKYADYEAECFLKFKNEGEKAEELSWGIQRDRKQWLRKNVWNRLPILIRPFFYFFYRYFFRLGFLDGKEGLIYHFLQGFWFYFLIDVKYLELRKHTGSK